MTIIKFPKGENSCCGTAKPKQTTLTLPVARQTFCRIRFDRSDSQVRSIPPAGALKWLEENLQQGAEITGVELAGPGDPLAEIAPTLETLELVRRQHPDLKLSLATLGLQAEEHAQLLAAVGVTGITLLVDAVAKEVADKLYAWIRPGKKTVPLSRATPLLLEEQSRAARALSGAGCSVTIQTTVYPGINDDHVGEIARVMGRCGARDMILVPYCGLPGQEEQMLIPPGLDLMQRVWKSAAEHLATTIVAERENRLGTDCPSLLGACKNPSVMALRPTTQRPNLAVASLSGMEVDLHLGQACHVLIYGPREDGLTCLLGTRPVPEPGNGSRRWHELAETLNDCFAILVASAGENPRRVLAEQGISVLITDGEIEGTVDQLYGAGRKKGKGSR